MKEWRSLPLLALLSACGIQGGKAPSYPDYCERSHKTFSDIEKINAAIEYKLKNEERDVSEINDNIGHLMRYKVKYPNGTPREVAEKYYMEFPECCRVIKPPSYTKWYEAMSDVGISEQEIIGKPGEWVADVLIVDLARTKESQRLQQAQFRVGGCNHISLINRG